MKNFRFLIFFIISFIILHTASAEPTVKLTLKGPPTKSVVSNVPCYFVVTGKIVRKMLDINLIRSVKVNVNVENGEIKSFKSIGIDVKSSSNHMLEFEKPLSVWPFQNYTFYFTIVLEVIPENGKDTLNVTAKCECEYIQPSINLISKKTASSKSAYPIVSSTPKNLKKYLIELAKYRLNIYQDIYNTLNSSTLTYDEINKVFVNSIVSLSYATMEMARDEFVGEILSYKLSGSPGLKNAFDVLNIAQTFFGGPLYEWAKETLNSAEQLTQEVLWTLWSRGYQYFIKGDLSKLIYYIKQEIKYLKEGNYNELRIIYSLEQSPDPNNDYTYMDYILDEWIKTACEYSYSSTSAKLMMYYLEFLKDFIKRDRQYISNISKLMYPPNVVVDVPNIIAVPINKDRTITLWVKNYGGPTAYLGTQIRLKLKNVEILDYRAPNGSVVDVDGDTYTFKLTLGLSAEKNITLRIKMVDGCDKGSIQCTLRYAPFLNEDKYIEKMYDIETVGIYIYPDRVSTLCTDGLKEVRLRYTDIPTKALELTNAYLTGTKEKMELKIIDIPTIGQPLTSAYLSSKDVKLSHELHQITIPTEELALSDCMVFSKDCALKHALKQTEIPTKSERLSKALGFSKDVAIIHKLKEINIPTIPKKLTKPFFSGFNAIFLWPPIRISIPTLPVPPISEMQTIGLVMIGMAIVVASIVKRKS